MAWAEAARSISESFRFQLALSGDLPARLSYAARYWATYLYAKRVKGIEERLLNAWALDALAQRGLTARRVRVRLPEAAVFDLDQLTCFMILREVWGERIYELEGGAFAPHPGQVVFDIGAQQGVYTVLAARAVGPTGKVVAIEPEPANFTALSRNIALNGLAHVWALELALSDNPGRATLHRSAWNTGGHSLLEAEGSSGEVSVKVATVDGLLRDERLPAPSLIKIDVEGSALAILRGAVETLRAARPRLVLELDRMEDAAAVAALLKPLGYRIQTRDNNLFAAAD